MMTITPDIVTLSSRRLRTAYVPLAVLTLALGVAIPAHADDVASTPMPTTTISPQQQETVGTGSDSTSQPPVPSQAPEADGSAQSPVRLTGQGRWIASGSRWWWRDNDGSYPHGVWGEVEGSLYAFDGSGWMRTGWFKDGDAWYYLTGSGAMARGWAKVASTWYYLDPATGKMATGWLHLGPTWYYLTPSGAMVTGRQVVDGRESAFAASGAWQGYTTASGAASDAGSRSPAVQHAIMSAPAASRRATTAAMVRAYQRSGATYPAQALGRGGATSIEAFVGLVYDEAVAEGVSPELLFVQAMKETAWLRFGGDVRVTQLNFGGIGATGGGAGGASFGSVREGLRAQVQHLRAYADPSVTQAKLAHPVVDPRFAYVRKGSARYVEHLGASENPQGVGWATDKGYGTSLAQMMSPIFGI